MTSHELLTASGVILNSLNDGVYACDRDRRIVFWSNAAERITGWQSADVVGRRCLDGVLCHIDKDGHQLCGEEFCPLHRSMVTGTQSMVGLIVYAQCNSGARIPMEVTVSPIRDESGEIIGGVETFRDVSQVLAGLNRAKRIQSLSLDIELPKDPRISFTTLFVARSGCAGSASHSCHSRGRSDKFPRLRTTDACYPGSADPSGRLCRARAVRVAPDRLVVDAVFEI